MGRMPRPTYNVNGSRYLYITLEETLMGMVEQSYWSYRRVLPR